MRSLIDLVGPQRWPAVRAALLGVVVLVHGLTALPLPRTVSADRAASAPAQEEIGLWLAVLASIGLHPSAEQLLGLVNQAAKATSSVRRALVAPAKPLMRFTQTGQAWALFAYPDRFPQRLVVEGRAGEGAWETLYRGLDPAHQVVGPEVRFRRVRGVYDTVTGRDKPGKTYERFVDFVADRAFAARPDLDQVRVLMVQFHVELPDSTATRPEVVRLTRTREREVAR